MKKIFFVIIFSFLFIPVFSQFYSKHQRIPADHWIYSALSTLEYESGICGIIDCAPASINELLLSFSLIEYENLSNSGKVLYKKIENFLSPKKPLVDFEPIKLSANLILYPQFLYKSNSEIDWTFASDYTGHIAYNYANAEWDSINYGASSNYSGNKLTKAFLQMPLYLDFGDLIFFESDFFVGKSFWAMQADNNFTNILYKGSDSEFLWPDFAYGSTGWLFNNGWGIDFHLGKQGMQFGRTLTGSIIYNDSFQTDFYSQLNLYSRNFKYNLDVVQVSNKNFLYLHSFEAIPFKWLKLGAIEGTLINSPFELRYLNPLMIFHSFASWKEYGTSDEKRVYTETHTCAYLGITFDIVPFKNFRFYGLMAQTEIQPPNELTSAYGRQLPNGIGFQSGIEYKIPEKHNGYFTINAEGFYLSPFLYIKQSGDWSLYRQRYNMQSNSSIPICSWIGSPFGPDSAGFEVQASYEEIDKWNVDLAYLFVAHGSNSFGMFQENYTDSANMTWAAFYPSALVKLGLIDQEKAEEIARSMALTGILQYTNQIMLKATYDLNSHFSFDAGLVYCFVFNNNNQQGNFAQGVQINAACEFRLF
ncbi:MAG: hypothetical protein K5829_07250 [Treponema sp.]|nr:hypothetical protein [Treponema sp.]